MTVALKSSSRGSVRQYASGGILGILLWSAQAWGQLPVTDAENFLVNSESAAQNTITAAQMISSVLNEITELTPLEEVVVRARIAADLVSLGEILAEANDLYYDIQSLNTQLVLLFGLENAPRTRSALEARVAAIKAMYYRSLTFSARVQTLIKTIFNTIEDVQALIDSISELIGNHQANQTIAQTTSNMAKTLAMMQTQDAAWQRADTLQRLGDMVTIESLNGINEDRLIDHPRY